MRILRIAQKLYPDVKGGGAYHVHAMSRDQAAMGHDVTVLTVRQAPTLPRVEERNGYTVIRCGSATKVFGNDISPELARYLVDVDEFDVLHAHSHLYFATNLTAVKRFFSDIPLAVTNHGLYSQNAPERLFDLYLRSVGRWTFNQADVVFCYTPTEKERLRRLGVSSRVAVVSNGIDTERFTPSGPESDLIDHDGSVVVFVGRLVGGKRPQDVLRALSHVRRTNSDVELYFCGDGPLRSELESISARLGIADGVTFLGHVPYEEMPRIYRASDVLVLPSRSEGVPRTVLEAMATDIPAVTSDLEQVVPIVTKGGQTVATGNPDQFAIALSNELEGTTAGRSPRSVIETGKYDWDSTVDETTKQLRVIARSTKPKPPTRSAKTKR
ncbi:glycosyl transferase family 1 [Halostagnicola sp. A56]|uniref:glycosyltransferase family 4 protein n=1 Tax=Halostagnicola sp. A56 TaxID=1495067 RepID=UPI0004A02D25|nr:glycosyltransferase family 4 protein [Halostagnicola sp. A56]KDE57515.1 glycosyl transferase family 1 [Halostagnicola sp. A56]